MEKEKAKRAVRALPGELDMWSFYEAGDWPVAKTTADFIRFLLSPGTQSIEIVAFDYEQMTFALYGPPGEDGVPGVVLKTLEKESTALGERKLIVAAVGASYPGGCRARQQMARTVAAYFDVTWRL